MRFGFRWVWIAKGRVCPQDGLAALAAGDGGLGFFVGFPVALGGALVPVLLAFGESELAFDATVFEVELDRYERVALLAGGDFELGDFGFVEKELAGAKRLVVHGVPVREGADVGVEQEGFAVFEQTVGVLEVGFAFADGFDLGAAQRNAGFDAVGEEVVEAGGAVESGVTLAGGDGVAVFGLDGALWRRGCSRVGRIARHGVSVCSGSRV
jgi:hypothetical protein